MELIDWSDGLHEPPLTCKSTTAEVKKFVDEPMQVPPWHCHAQSIERCVKQITEAAGKVHTQEKRKRKNVKRKAILETKMKVGS